MGILLCKDAKATVDGNYHEVYELQEKIKRLEREIIAYRFGIAKLVNLYDSCEHCRNISGYDTLHR